MGLHLSSKLYTPSEGTPTEVEEHRLHLPTTEINFQ